VSPVTIQEGRGETRALVYLLHVGDAKPNARYPRSTFDAIREACGPDPMIVVRSDDGTSGHLPIVDGTWDRLRDGQDGVSISRIVAAGWSAGVRGIRRFLLADDRKRAERPTAWTFKHLAGIVAADGLHAPWSLPPIPHEARDLGPSEVFREWIEKARTSWCPTCHNYARIHVEQGSSPECYEPCPDCANTRPFGFVLTHCMQTYMEAKNVSPRYLSTSTVARELTGWPCTGGTNTPVGDGIEIRQEGRLEVHSYAGPKVDYAGHVRQLREALPRALGRLRGMGVL
jgi:hypothetical protein